MLPISHLSPFSASFVVNIGKDPANIVLHFNARFDIHGDVKTIVCNSKNNGEWGTEQRETTFPFQEGSTAEVRLGMTQGWDGVLVHGTHLSFVP